MKLAFVFVGGHKETWVTEFSDEYQKRLSFFVSTDVIRLRPSRLERGSRDQKCLDESSAILKQLSKDDVVILCDEKGDELSSPALSKKIVKLLERGKQRLVIIIGGAYGASDELKARADWTWSLSELTFNHHFAQVISLEQIYRAFTIWKGLPYHND